MKTSFVSTVVAMLLSSQAVLGCLPPGDRGTICSSYGAVECGCDQQYLYKCVSGTKNHQWEVIQTCTKGCYDKACK